MICNKYNPEPRFGLHLFLIRYNDKMFIAIAVSSGDLLGLLLIYSKCSSDVL